jgi:hypothetical protein
MTFPKFVEKHRKMTDLWPKKSVFGDFRVKTWLFLRLVNFKKLHFLGELLMMGGYFFCVASQYTCLETLCTIFFNFHFLPIFRRANMVYGVNWPKLHGNKPIIAKKIKMKKNRAQRFLEPPQGAYIKNFRLI